MIEHNHLTRDIKAYRECPACDLYWRAHLTSEALAIADDDARYAADSMADLLAAANKGADDA